MSLANQLRVTLGKPIPELNAHKPLHVYQDVDEKALTVSFKRTIRVPDDGTTYQLPPNLGNFPLYNVNHYKETLPESMMLKGGCFMPVHEREALWIRFKSTRPFAIKIYLGGINAISCEPIIENFATSLRRSHLLHEKKSIQDYAVIDPADKGQLWLDGIAKVNGKVMQFVAVPSGSGYSVEAQIASIEVVGGIQISVTPIKMGPVVTVYIKRLLKATLVVRTHLNATVYELMQMISIYTGTPIEQLGILFNNLRLKENRLLSHYGVKENSTLNLVLKLQGGGLLDTCNATVSPEMSLGAGGLITQSILRDPHPSAAWDTENTAMFNIQLLNAALFHRVTGMHPPPSPVSAEAYAAAGLPFFELPYEIPSGIEDNFEDIKTVSQLDLQKGSKGLEKELEFPIIQLDKGGQRVPFRAVDDMEKQLKSLRIAQFT